MEFPDLRLIDRGKRTQGTSFLDAVKSMCLIHWSGKRTIRITRACPYGARSDQSICVFQGSAVGPAKSKRRSVLAHFDPWRPRVVWSTKSPANRGINEFLTLGI